jgi:hypothetical protein
VFSFPANSRIAELPVAGWFNYTLLNNYDQGHKVLTPCGKRFYLFFYPHITFVRFLHNTGDQQAGIPAVDNVCLELSLSGAGK